MSLRVISYDLDGYERPESYEKVIAAIKELGDWIKPQYSLFFVDTGLASAEVRDRLTPLFDENDRLLVADVSGDEMAWYGFTAEETSWIKQHHS